MTIGPFRGQNRWLSNFWESPITLNGVVYATAEHYYQSSKTHDPTLRNAIAQAETPGAAKKAGSLIVPHEHWEGSKLPAMRQAVVFKFTQNTDLAGDLLDTNDELLVELNEWHDNFWGNCTCSDCSGILGENNLGKILMETRQLINYIY